MKRSRGTTGSKGRSIFRKKGARVLLSLAGVFAALAGIFPVTRHYAGSIDGIWRDTKLEPPSEYGLDYVPVAFDTSDGLNIQGWIMETTEDAPVVIFLHGFGDNRASSPGKVFGIAGALIRKGYNVFMFDFRGQGLSQGNRISAGLYETDDVLSAIKYLRQRGNTGAVGILGFSMGWRNASFRGYADYMQTEEFERSLQDLIDLAAFKPTAVMCAEAVPWRCHRSLIADPLVARGFSVSHIINSGRVQAHKLTPWARVDGTRITYPSVP